LGQAKPFFEPGNTPSRVVYFNLVFYATNWNPVELVGKALFRIVVAVAQIHVVRMAATALIRTPEVRVAAHDIEANR
jgi:hypothetical protein